MKLIFTFLLFILVTEARAQMPLHGAPPVLPTAKKGIKKKRKPFAKGQEIKWDVLQEIELVRKKGKITGVKPSAYVKTVLGKSLSLKGFMIPLDYESKVIKEFLFVPYIPSCMHVPPPPANQVIHVKMAKKKKAKPTYYPVQVFGKISLEKKQGNEFMESSLSMVGTKVKELK